MDDFITCPECDFYLEVTRQNERGGPRYCPGCRNQVALAVQEKESVPNTVGKCRGIWYDEASKTYHWNQYDGKGGLVAKSISLQEVHMKRRPGNG